MVEAEMLSKTTGISAACKALGVPRCSFYRARQPAQTGPAAPSPRALSEQEKKEIRTALNSKRFRDKPPREVYAALLDEGKYLCSWRTMYRILEEHDEVRERRDQLRHPNHKKPQLSATKPNQVWSWDITKLMSPVKWSYFYLYVIIDIYSRFVPGWMIAGRETSSLAQVFIDKTCEKQGIQQEQLTLHADRGGPMIAKSMALLLAELGVSKSHSRPHNSDDNPYSESQFKTLKYRPDYPDYFESESEARDWSRTFFGWYNYEHYHSALGLLTPADVHYGRAKEIIEKRQEVLLKAYDEHPERFVNGPPQHPQLPTKVWINPPLDQEDKEADNDLEMPTTTENLPSTDILFVGSWVSKNGKLEPKL